MTRGTTSILYLFEGAFSLWRRRLKNRLFFGDFLDRIYRIDKIMGEWITEILIIL